jgi:hypothetical protein
MMNVRKSVLALCIAAGAATGSLATPALADVYLRFGPPAPIYEPVPVVQPGWVWIPGYWDWNGHRHVWVNGRHVHARHGSYWVPNRWCQHNGRGRLDRGHWAENNRRDRHDRDQNDHRG